MGRARAGLQLLPQPGGPRRGYGLYQGRDPQDAPDELGHQQQVEEPCRRHGVTCYTCHRGNVRSRRMSGPRSRRRRVRRACSASATARTRPQRPSGLATLPLRSVHALSAEGHAHPRHRPDAAAHERQRAQHPADRGHVCVDDAHVDRPGSELRLLPQLALVHVVGRTAAARDRLPRHPHGSRHQRQLHRVAGLDVPRQPQGTAGRRLQDQLRDLPPGREQAAGRRSAW